MNAQELSWTTTEEKKQIWHKRPGWSRNLHPGAVYSLTKAQWIQVNYNPLSAKNSILSERKNNMENTKNVTNNEKITWNDLETMLATEIVRKAKRETKQWFSAWLLTAALLILSDVLWYFAYNM